MFSFLEKNRIYFVYLPLGTYWLFLFIATTLPGNSVPDVGVGDKVIHFIAYMILSILLSLTFMVQKKSHMISLKPILFTIVVIAVYGALDEIHQYFIPGRFCELADLAADLSGALIGSFITKFLIR